MKSRIENYKKDSLNTILNVMRYLKEFPSLMTNVYDGGVCHVDFKMNSNDYHISFCRGSTMGLFCIKYSKYAHMISLCSGKYSIHKESKVLIGSTKYDELELSDKSQVYDLFSELNYLFVNKDKLKILDINEFNLDKLHNNLNNATVIDMMGRSMSNGRYDIVNEENMDIIKGEVKVTSYFCDTINVYEFEVEYTLAMDVYNDEDNPNNKPVPLVIKDVKEWEMVFNEEHKVGYRTEQNGNTYTIYRIELGKYNMEEGIIEYALEQISDIHEGIIDWSGYESLS